MRFAYTSCVIKELTMENTLKHCTLICENMQKLELTGVQKVESSTPTQFVCTLQDKQMVVGGKNLHIKKLDLQSESLVIDGEIELIKYQSPKKSFLKRIFK